MTRVDRRKNEELRPITAKVGVIKNAEGSAMLKIGGTTAIAAVYGPRDLYPRFKQDPKKGLLRCDYNMMPFSGHGDRVRPGGGRRSKEISMVTQKAINPVIDLKNCPNAVVDVFIELTETDAGTRCAGITAAAMALADAGIEMKDLVIALSVGMLDGELLVDINGKEDCELGATDIPIAYIPSMDKISLLQIDGEITREDLKKALEVGKKKCLEIYEIQKKALKQKYSTANKTEKVKSK
ncbi:exosome complex exonuclease Rrp41 [Candidatus Woesearchaeota archaeon]|nr:exosome complex exonuclease Rrp41 [Candidatus Woesearchaeota archaeon]MBW2978695.1 exosome complex exonuclease Rrp41 [Candidatus Woesearchaeota archaeon]